jgi:hypothetical protein
MSVSTDTLRAEREEYLDLQGVENATVSFYFPPQVSPIPSKVTPQTPSGLNLLHAWDEEVEFDDEEDDQSTSEGSVGNTNIGDNFIGDAAHLKADHPCKDDQVSLHCTVCPTSIYTRLELFQRVADRIPRAGSLVKTESLVLEDLSEDEDIEALREHFRQGADIQGPPREEVSRLDESVELENVGIFERREFTAFEHSGPQAQKGRPVTGRRLDFRTNTKDLNVNLVEDVANNVAVASSQQPPSLGGTTLGSFAVSSPRVETEQRPSCTTDETADHRMEVLISLLSQHSLEPCRVTEWDHASEHEQKQEPHCSIEFREHSAHVREHSVHFREHSVQFRELADEAASRGELVALRGFASSSSGSTNKCVHLPGHPCITLSKLSICL